MTFDDLRAAHPTLGFAVYAYEPGGVVTLEVIAPDGATFAFPLPSLQAAIDTAFPQPAKPREPPPEDLFS